MNISPDWAALLPMLVLTGVGALLPLIGAFRVRAGWLAGFAVIGLLVAFVLNIATIWSIPGLDFMPHLTASGPAVVSFELLELTPFVVLFDLVFIAVALLVVIASPKYLKRRHQGEYYSLLLLSTVGMMSVAGSRDLITLFVGLELSSFCTYALAGFHKTRKDSSEAAMKYFLIGSISSALAIFGISLVYGLTGGTTFDALATLWSNPLSTVGGTTTVGRSLLDGHFTIGVFVWVLLLAGFGYKIALVPFHNYAVDVYEGSPDTVSGFLAAGSKQMGFAALFKVFLLGLFAVKANWDIMVAVIAVVTMVVGNVAALRQTNIKRMLAYSSIAQAGYILMALAIGTPYALAGGLFHIVTYSFMQAGAFVALAAAATWGIGESMDDWKGMSKRAPFLAFAMAVFLLSFAGIPPLAGFASKFVLFSSAIQAGIAPGVTGIYAFTYIGLAIAGILTSAISLVYYWRLIRVMYIEDETESRRVAVSSSAGIAVIIALVATIFIGLFPAAILDLALDAARSMFTAVALAGS
ncbi:MAG: NADH-quinone oxidoreductase subunit N [Candidatus Thermoplasmatota archaeon]